ncbi:hypothetical protein [Streptomyces lonegramiae]|uniref:Uncharacterized protein n=1 Tax=Streptomyces lonegramiae TaxID=3075524 RepID=A0ABU2XIE1_9ACTN|nr:hypothetical protein [Streptomyces sp. DSM 41529]MDT0545690.1 hypothetical protein [Streptomyces sp. DSM 41529]
MPGRHRDRRPAPTCVRPRWGKRGTIHQACRDGMEDQLGTLGLALNAVVL